MIDNQKLAMTLRSFAAERDWDQFHTPKNLATSISVEAAELLELFQWSRGQKGWDEVTDPSIRARVEDELADILLYLIRFADKAGIDLEAIAERKIASNAAKVSGRKVSRFRSQVRRTDILFSYQGKTGLGNDNSDPRTEFTGKNRRRSR